MYSLVLETRGSNASRFCQYTLRFSIRFIHTICVVLESELRETLSQRKEGTSESNGMPSQMTELLLPLVRTYTSWLAARRHEIFEAAAALPVVFDMLQSLASIFTLLCVETLNQENLSTCPYLLPEDLAMRGLRPLSDGQVPEPCRYQCQGDGNLKPHLQSPEQRLGPHYESFARILDILRGAYYLAEDPTVPLGFRVLENWLVFEYQPHSVEAATAARNTGKTPMNGSHELQGQALEQPAAASREKAAETAPLTNPSELGAAGSESPPVTDINGQLNNHVDDDEKAVIDRLAPFLRPPTPQHPRSPDEPSYGMHTATANEAFASAQAGPSPNGSGPSRKLEPLPWNWVYTPTPHRRQDPASVGREAFSGHRGSNRSSKGSIAGTMMPEDPFAMPGNYPMGRADQLAQLSLGGPSGEEAHRGHLLQSFANATSAPNPNAPRVSAFSSWSHSGVGAQRQPGPAPPSPWRTSGLDNAPMSTDASGFSQLSSLYHGTPGNYGAPPAAGFGGAGQAQQQLPPPGEHGSASRQFRMDETTSSYDAAILQAAYFGNK